MYELISAAGGIKEGINLLDKIGVLERLALKLVSNPDKALNKLIIALNELNMGYTTLYNEMLALGNIDLEDNDHKKARKQLTRVKEGHIKASIISVKGSCARIGKIYDTYLNGWFSCALGDDKDVAELDQLFWSLRDVDDLFLEGVNKLTEIAEKGAKDILLFIDTNRLSEAKQAIDELEGQLAPLREQLCTDMRRLWSLQEQFIKASHTV